MQRCLAKQDGFMYFYCALTLHLRFQLGIHLIAHLPSYFLAYSFLLRFAVTQLAPLASWFDHVNGAADGLTCVSDTNDNCCFYSCMVTVANGATQPPVPQHTPRTLPYTCVQQKRITG